MACGRGYRVCARAKPYYAVSEQSEHKDADARGDDEQKVVKAVNAFHDGGGCGLEAELPVMSDSFRHDEPILCDLFACC